MELSMSMRTELAPRPLLAKRDEDDNGAWAVIGFCAIGIALTLYLAATTSDLPALITAYSMF
jgi:hypothetical protein